MTHRGRSLWLVLGAVFLADWALGVLHVRGMPSWVFVLFNIPFGVAYTALESTWTGTRYEVLGRSLGDGTSLAVFAFVVLAQGMLYYALLDRWLRRRAPEQAPA